MKQYTRDCHDVPKAYKYSLTFKLTKLVINDYTDTSIDTQTAKQASKLI